jgi:hypothetical protein
MAACGSCRASVSQLAATLCMCPWSWMFRRSTMTQSINERQRDPFARCCILQVDGATPLLIACQKGHLEVVTILLNRGASHAQATVCLGCWRLIVRRMTSLKHTTCTMDDPAVAPLADCWRNATHCCLSSGAFGDRESPARSRCLSRPGNGIAQRACATSAVQTTCGS